MTRKRNLKRESLEVYLLYLLIGYRPIFRVSGLLLLICTIFAWRISRLAGNVSLLISIFLLLAAYSHRMTMFLAKMGAWFGTIWSRDNR